MCDVPQEDSLFFSYAVVYYDIRLSVLYYPNPAGSVFVGKRICRKE